MASITFKNGFTVNFQNGFTPFDNYFLDYIMPRISCAEWKVVCLVIRETIGKACEDAEIKLDHFMNLTSFERQAVVIAIRNACHRTVIERRTVQNGRQRTFRYKAIPRANLKELPKPDLRRHQSKLPFDATEFDFQTLSAHTVTQNAPVETIEAA